MSSLSPYVTDKRVLLYGSVWEDYHIEHRVDTIVSLNSQQTKSHILYNNGAGNTLNFKQQQHPRHYMFLTESSFAGSNAKWARTQGVPCSFISYQDDCFKELMNGIGDGLPFLGTLAMYHLVSLNPKSLTVIGCPCYGNVPQDEWPLSVHSHDPRANGIMVYKLFLSNLYIMNLSPLTGEGCTNLMQTPMEDSHETRRVHLAA